MQALQTVWGWQPALYLFLGGLGAGAFIAATLLYLRDSKKNLPVANTAMWAAFLCIVVGLVLLITELTNPLRGMMLWQSFSQFGSWMTIGAWLLFTAVVFIFAVGVLTFPALNREPAEVGEAKAAKGRFADKPAVKALAVIGAVLSLGVAVYTGILLMAVPGVPFWHTPVLPCLFTVSALDTGVALVELIALTKRNTAPLAERSFLNLEKAVVFLVIVEAAVLVLFFALMLAGNEWGAAGSASFAETARWSANLLIGGELSALFWVVLVGCGLCLPFAVALAAAILAGKDKHLPPAATAIGAIGALAGGCVLRFLVVLAGTHVDYILDSIVNLGIL